MNPSNELGVPLERVGVWGPTLERVWAPTLSRIGKKRVKYEKIIHIILFFMK